MQNAPAFTGTGPQGHRGRMRVRLLADPAALADYEILEMLLFLGIPRRDTKPQAKGLINVFGSLAATVGAAPAELSRAGMPPGVVDAFGLVQQAAAYLAATGPRDRPKLGDWLALEDYLDPRARAQRPPGYAALLLDSRNQLIAEAGWPHDLDWGSVQREVLRQALTNHAGALVMVRSEGAGRAALRADDRARHAALAEAADALSLLVHDWLVIGGGDWLSLRQAGGS